MELLEFKGKILELCKVKEIKDIGVVLMSAVLNNDIDFFCEYKNIIDDSKDWLQALWQYYEADRTEKKQDYTPKSLCKLVASLAGRADTVYDCCGGSGALTKAFIDMHGTKNVLVEELDERVIPFLLFNLCLHNVSGYVVNGNVLSKEKIKCFQLVAGDKYSKCQITDSAYTENIADVSISNPPYNIKWEPPTPLENDIRFPVIPPASNANYAFVLNCLARAKDKAILILPNSVLSSKQEVEMRRYLIENDFVEAIVAMPDKMFECTDIATCIMVLNKNKKNKGKVVLIHSVENCVQEEREQRGQFGGASHMARVYKKIYNVLTDENIKKILDAIEKSQEVKNFSLIKTRDEIKEKNFRLQPSVYFDVEFEDVPHRSFQEIADNINYISRMQNACKLVINETIAKRLGLDVETFKQGKENSRQMQEQMESLGVDLEIEDYIQFTKNKNEFVFKCNDKELFPDILIQFFNVWKNQIALLNTMQNQYLAELRDALLPDLISGKIEL